MADLAVGIKNTISIGIDLDIGSIGGWQLNWFVDLAFSTTAFWIFIGL